MSYQANSYTQQLTQPNRNGMWPSVVFPQADIPALIQDPATGAVYLNPKKSTQKWAYLSASPYPLSLDAEQSLPTTLTPPLEEGAAGDLEIIKLTSTSTGRFAVMFEDTVSQRRFMNNPVPNNMVFGTAQLPFVLYQSIFLPATANLVAQCTDLSVASNDVRVNVEGRRFIGCGPKQALWQAFQQRRTHPYWMTFDQGSSVTVDANSTNTFNMTVPTAGDFNCWLIMDDSATDYRIRIFEGSSGRCLMIGPGEDGLGKLSCQNFVASSTYSVTGMPGNTVRAANFPHAWTFTHLFKRGTQIQMELTNTTGAQITVRLALHGQLIYYNDCPGYADPDRARMLQQAMVPMPAPANWIPCAVPGCGSSPEPIPGYVNQTQAPQLPMAQTQQATQASPRTMVIPGVGTIVEGQPGPYAYMWNDYEPGPSGVAQPKAANAQAHGLQQRPWTPPTY